MESPVTLPAFLVLETSTRLILPPMCRVCCVHHVASTRGVEDQAAAAAAVFAVCTRPGQQSRLSRAAARREWRKARGWRWRWRPSGGDSFVFAQLFYLSPLVHGCAVPGAMSHCRIFVDSPIPDTLANFRLVTLAKKFLPRHTGEKDGKNKKILKLSKDETLTLGHIRTSNGHF